LLAEEDSTLKEVVQWEEETKTHNNHSKEVFVHHMNCNIFEEA